MNRQQAARRIVKAAKGITGNVNIFIFPNGIVTIDEVSGSWGHGLPANPEKYADYFLDIPASWLTDVDIVLERVLD